jgi:hypothetical protein
MTDPSVLAAPSAVLTIVCGITHLDPRAEALTRTLRAAEGFKTDGGCGKPFDLTSALQLARVYRCVECARWLCKACILQHFAETQHDQLAGQSSLPTMRGDDDDLGGWVQVYTGGRFYPLDPRAEDVDIRDIAHALSLLCRYTGHTRVHYSVAEHALLLCQAAAKRHPKNYHEQLQALMHDAAEAYICDLPRPIKPHIPGYKQIERRIEVVIQEKYGLLAAGKTPLVDELDSLVLYDEAKALMPIESIAWHERFAPGLGLPVRALAAPEAEAEFLLTFQRLRLLTAGGASC